MPICPECGHIQGYKDNAMVCRVCGYEYLPLLSSAEMPLWRFLRDQFAAALTCLTSNALCGSWRFLRAGLLSGAVLFAVGVVFHLAVPFIAPELAREYQNAELFRPWKSWTWAYMAIHPWLYGMLFAGVFLRVRAAAGAARLGGLRDGLCYGCAVFLVGSLPVFALNLASFNIPVGIIAVWVLQSLVQNAIAGLALGWYCASPSSGLHRGPLPFRGSVLQRLAGSWVQ